MCQHNNTEPMGGEADGDDPRITNAIELACIALEQQRDWTVRAVLDNGHSDPAIQRLRMNSQALEAIYSLYDAGLVGDWTGEIEKSCPESA